LELEGLINRLPAIEGEIINAGHNLLKSSEALYYKVNPSKIGTNDDDTSAIPAYLESQVGFSELWAQLGGLDDSLNIFPKLTGLSESLAEVIKHYYKKAVYLPRKGIKFFMHH
jgi:hypothetical protein